MSNKNIKEKIEKTYKAIYVDDSNSMFREKMITDFEKRNVGCVLERTIIDDDGQTFIYRVF